MSTLPQPSPTVVCCDVEGGAVLLSTVNETYYGLNPVGMRVWSLLTESGSFEALCVTLGKEYPEVELATITEDVSALLEDLKTSGLVA